ncbi:MAG: GGDEF domain-containing protein [Propionivibrio sp.]
MLSASVPCFVESAAFGCAPATVVGLPQTVVRDAGMLELLAAEMRIAELEAELAAAREAAYTDPLTGALNRRGFDNACRRELSRARRNGAPLAIVHVDLDDFKHLNDTFGHQAGDLALCQLVSVLQKSMRPSDVLCRFGGEEFVLMLPETSLPAATEVVSRFLRKFSAQTIPGTGRRMTFSAGVVTPRCNESLDEAIQRADAATYAAKHAGKNCVVAG